MSILKRRMRDELLKESLFFGPDHFPKRHRRMGRRLQHCEVAFLARLPDPGCLRQSSLQPALRGAKETAEALMAAGWKFSGKSAAITSVTDTESDEMNPSTNLEQRQSLRSSALPERANEMMRIQGVSGRWEEGPRGHATKLCSCYVPFAMAARVASSCDEVRGRLRNTHHVRRHDPNGLSVAYDNGNRRLSSLA